MSFEVYDYHTDIRHLLGTPEIQARFLRLEVGGPGLANERPRGHSHDLDQ